MAPLREFYLLPCALILLSLLSGCRNLNVSSGGQPDFLTVLTELPENHYMPKSVADTIYSDLDDRQAVAEFYNLRRHELIWFRNGKINPMSDTLIQLLSQARYYGLYPSFYHYEELVDLNSMQLEDMTRRDALLTDAFLSFITDVQFGRTETFPHQESIPELVSFLASGNLKSTVSSVEPNYSQYHLLKSSLRELIDHITENQPGQQTESYKYKSSAVVQSIHCIEINLERWRNEPEEYPDSYVFVNIPSYTLQVYHQDAIALESRTIVGSSDKPTPEWTSKIECLVIYPYWNVPRKIAVEEFLPQIQNDSSFLSRNHFEIIDREKRVVNKDSIDWKKINADFFPFSIRQREGPDNSLGLVKFVFDNPFAIYLHDTNSRKLFKNSDRALSHGCIRMEHAVEFAHYLITGSVDKKSPEVLKYMDRQERHVITLKQDMPLFIRYLTAEVKNGVTYYFQDVYNRDTDLYQRFLHAGK